MMALTDSRANQANALSSELMHSNTSPDPILGTPSSTVIRFLKLFIVTRHS